MKLYFQRSVYALIAMENQRPPPQLTEVGVTSEREEEVWRDGWCWLSLAQGSRIRPISQFSTEACHCNPALPTKQWTPRKRSLLRVRVPLAQPLKRNTKGSWMSFAQKQGGRAGSYFSIIQKWWLGNSSHPDSPRASSSSPWAEDAFSAHSSALGLPFWETLVWIRNWG